MEKGYQKEVKELRKELMKAVVILNQHGGSFVSNMVATPPRSPSQLKK
jgi:hypothetical protein